MFYPIAFSAYPSPADTVETDPIVEKTSTKKNAPTSMTPAPRPARTSLVSYGPIRIRRRHTVSSTLATGRRSKDEMIEGEDPVKREIRRLKNRDAARRLKAERDGIERDLHNQVLELEEIERTLLNEIDHLKLHKRRLEDQYDECVLYYRELVRHRSLSPFREYGRENESPNDASMPQPHLTEAKQEPRSPSPQWQLLFRI